MVGLPYTSDRDYAGWSGGDTQSGKAAKILTSTYKNYVPQNLHRSTAALAKMVESEIIPRLMLAHRDPVNNSACAQADPATLQDHLGPETTRAFCQMALTSETESLLAFLGSLVQRGLSLEAIYVELLMPTAQRLGKLWDEDRVSFTDTTIALSRLQQVVRILGWKAPDKVEGDEAVRSALFMAGPGEQHTFGLLLIDDFFRRAGWRTWIEPSADADAEDAVSGYWYDLFGMSLNADTHLEAAAARIRAIRNASRNPDIFILVGGRIFNQRPDLVAVIGADATASTGGEALILADKAVRRLALDV